MYFIVRKHICSYEVHIDVLALMKVLLELIVIVIAELILQPLRHFNYVTTHSTTLPPLHLRRCSFSNPSVVSPTSQFTLRPFFRFSCVTSSSLNSTGEPTMYLRRFLEQHQQLAQKWMGSLLLPLEVQPLWRRISLKLVLKISLHNLTTER